MFSAEQAKIPYDVAFFNAAADGNLELLKSLYDNHADEINPNKKFGDYDKFSLFIAAENGHTEVVKFLLELKKNPADPNQVKVNNVSPLFIAAHNGHLNVVNYLLEHHCAVDIPETSKHQTALHTAILKGHNDIVKSLLRAGANPDIQDLDGLAPLDHAFNNYELSTLLDGHTQKFHNALIQRMKAFGFNTDKEGVCFGFSEVLKILVFTENEDLINQFYSSLSWLKHHKAKDLLEIKDFHDNLIHEAEKETLKNLKVMNESELNLTQHIQFQKIVKEKLALRRSNLTFEEKKKEEHYLTIYALFTAIELEHLGYTYLHLLPRHTLVFISDHENFIKTKPRKGQILLSRGTNNTLEYKLVSTHNNIIENQMTLDDFRIELQDKYEAFHNAFIHNKSLNFYLNPILHMISKQEQTMISRVTPSQKDTPSWVTPLIQPPSKKQNMEEIELAHCTGVYNEQELSTYFKMLRQRIKENSALTTPLALNLYLSNHAILVIYHPDKDAWEFVNINNISQDPNQIKRILLPGDTDIAIHLKKPADKHILFNTRITTTQHAESQYKPLIDKWQEDLSVIHTPTTEKTKVTDVMHATWLSVAAQHGDLETVNTLLKFLNYKLDQHPVRKNGATPLYIAAQNGYLDIVNALLECDLMDANQAIVENGVTPLLIAAQHGHTEVVKALLESKKNPADPNKTSNDGITPLYIAAQEGHLEVVNALLACKNPSVDPNRICIAGTTALYVAAQNGHLEVVKALLAWKNPLVDPNIASDDGVTPLIVAAQRNHLEIVKALLECDLTDSNQANQAGATALFFAAQHGHHDIVSALLECKKHPANPNIAYGNDGLTPLYMAAQNNHPEVVKALLTCNLTDPNLATTKENVTPLFIAVQEGHLEVIKALLECENHTIDLDKRVIDDSTSLELAIENNDHDIIQLLLAYKDNRSTVHTKDRFKRSRFE